MINLEARISGHSLMLTSASTLPTGSIAVDQLQLTQVIGAEWQSCAEIKAQFWKTPSELYESDVDNDVALIPPEVLAGVGLLHIAVYGCNANGTVRISTNAVTLPVTKGSYSEASAPAPSESVFEQAVSKAIESAQNEFLTPNVVGNEVLAKMPAKSIKGNNSSVETNANDLTLSDMRSMFAFVPATSQRGGTAGFVPAPSINDTGKYLKSNGLWDTPVVIVTSISSSSTDDECPSAKCVYDQLGDIAALLEKL